MNAPATLPPEVAEFVQSGVSITVASRDDRLVPSIAKAVACRVSEARDEVTVLLFASVAEAVLRDVARHRVLAVAFSHPSTNRTLQLKGRGVDVQAARASDVALVRRSLALFAEDLRLLGWGPEFVQAALWDDPAHLMALRFAPEGAFLQTPGPQAGSVLPLRRADGL